ncbi:MAG: hypothetical protein EZS28_027317 [Streblomastix strix]|uniref:Transmembrane protein n=1 Tax=Streblomastix strix TaxID=222440 RepID=A0A5J4V3G7_9EUKA|nr:MAG: hypothetical protein EZS28_027317 [Streblomastix strix]
MLLIVHVLLTITLKAIHAQKINNQHLMKSHLIMKFAKQHLVMAVLILAKVKMLDKDAKAQVAMKQQDVRMIHLSSKNHALTAILIILYHLTVNNLTDQLIQQCGLVQVTLNITGPLAYLLYVILEPSLNATVQTIQLMIQKVVSVTNIIIFNIVNTPILEKHHFLWRNVQQPKIVSLKQNLLRMVNVCVQRTISQKIILVVLLRLTLMNAFEKSMDNKMDTYFWIELIITLLVYHEDAMRINFLLIETAHKEQNQPIFFITKH